MQALIQSAKALYQFTKTTVPEVWASSRYPYSYGAAIQRAKISIRSRISQTSGNINFIMAVPIVNWESTLIETSKAHGSCHHINFEARGFFETKEEWAQYRNTNLKILEVGFESAYKKDEINVLFLYLSDFHIDAAQLKRFKIHNVVIVHFNWDDRLHYTSNHKGQSVGVKKIANAVDFNLTMSVGPINRYVADGNAVFYWRGKQDLCVEELTLPKLEFDRVLFFGSRYGFRETLVDYLYKKKLPIDVYGDGWGTGVISYENLKYRIPRYALNLGISTIGYTHNLFCVKGRDIEVPSVGGLYLTNLSDEISYVYKIEEEILTYQSKDECYRRASKVLENPSAFSEVRRRGARKALQFSWDARFNYLTYLVKQIIGIEANT